jgi:endonuclease/exonuclease/phosphatase family metal-dependent hydrolase
MALHRATTRRGTRAVPVPARPVDAGSPALIGLVAVLTLLTLELIRFSGPLLDSTYSRGGAPLVALVAVLTYAAPGPAAALLLASTRRAAQPWPVVLLAGSLVLGLLRLIVQGLRGEARVGVGLLTVAVAVAVLVLAVSALAGRPGGGRAMTGAVLTGAAGSVGLQLALGTWDAPWRSTTLGWSVTAAAVASVVLLAALAGRELTAEPGRVRGRWALGPALALTALMLANPAFAAAQSGLPLAVAGPLLALGLLLAAGLAVHQFDRAVARPRVLAVPAAALVVSTAVALQVAGTTPLRSALVLAALAAAQLSTALLLSRVCWSTAGASRQGTAVTASLVGLTTIVPLLLFQLDYDVRLGFPNALVLVVTAAALAIGGLRGERQTSPNESVQRRGEGLPLLAALVLAVAGTVVVLSGWLQSQSAQDVTYTGRVVSWNLHYGVSPDGVVDLEAMARVIEAQDPDVVLLQEVSRGWIQGGGADMATWLSQRLDRSFVFAPAADGRFGNVILARGGMTNVRVQSLPYGAGPQRRSALTAVTQLGSRPTTVTSIHLQNRRQNAPTRIAQLETFLAADARSTEVLGGDLNATPGSTEVELLTGAGYVSAIDVAGDPGVLTAPSTAPTRRIDWVLGRRMSFAQAEVLTDVVLSDHLPLVVVLRP